MQEWIDGGTLDKEELSSNPFFVKLKNEYSELYRKAAEDNFLLCVPHSQTLGAIVYDEKLFKAHLLKTSPYFKEEYVTGNGQCVSLRGTEISTKTGFERTRLVKVLFEETFYNDDFKSFRVFCISAPLSGAIARPMKKDAKGTILSRGFADRSHAHWKFTIVSLLGDHAAVELIVELDKFIRQFNDSYVMIRGYTSDAAKKIKIFTRPLLEEAVNSELLAQPLTEAHMYELHLAVETYMMWHLRDKIWTQLYKHNTGKDKALNERLIRLSGLTHEQMGLQKDFMCDLTAAKQKFEEIPQKTTPIGMLSAVKDTTDTLRASIETHLKELSAREDGRTSEHVLAADDMLAFLSYLIIQTRLPKMATLVEYLENFHTSRSITSELDYGLATLSGALSYVQSSALDSHLADPPQRPKPSLRQVNSQPMAKRSSSSRGRCHVVTGDIPTRSRRRGQRNTLSNIGSAPAASLPVGVSNNPFGGGQPPARQPEPPLPAVPAMDPTLFGRSQSMPRRHQTHPATRASAPQPPRVSFLAGAPPSGRRGPASSSTRGRRGPTGRFHRGASLRDERQERHLSQLLGSDPRAQAPAVIKLENRDGRGNPGARHRQGNSPNSFLNSLRNDNIQGGRFPGE